MYWWSQSKCQYHKYKTMGIGSTEEYSLFKRKLSSGAKVCQFLLHVIWKNEFKRYFKRYEWYLRIEFVVLKAISRDLYLITYKLYDINYMILSYYFSISYGFMWYGLAIWPMLHEQYVNVVSAKSCKVPVYYLFEQHFKASVNLKLSYLGDEFKNPSLDQLFA